MRPPPNPVVALALTAVLMAGIPVSRGIPIIAGDGAVACSGVGLSPCVADCPADAAPPCSGSPCGPCPLSGSHHDSRSGKTATCDVCVLCLCGVGVLAPETVLALPTASGSTGLEPGSTLQAVEREPALPPPKALA